MVGSGPIVFLFDEDQLDYGEAEASLLRALKKVDANQTTRSLVLRGSLLIRQVGGKRHSERCSEITIFNSRKIGKTERTGPSGDCWVDVRYCSRTRGHFSIL